MGTFSGFALLSILVICEVNPNPQLREPRENFDPSVAQESSSRDIEFSKCSVIKQVFLGLRVWFHESASYIIRDHPSRNPLESQPSDQYLFSDTDTRSLCRDEFKAWWSALRASERRLVKPRQPGDAERLHRQRRLGCPKRSGQDFSQQTQQKPEKARNASPETAR